VKIAGLEKCSFVDYPGCLAAVIFTPGCNMDCYYCHNHSLVSGAENNLQKWFDADAALGWLDKRKGFLDAVVITGGEPTLQPGLAEFARAVKAKGYKVKLDTNGTRPAIVRKLIDEGLLDYVAMDVKAPFEKYDAVCRVPVDSRAINETIDILLSGRVDYEFRTTVLPQFTEMDMLSIARRIHNAKRFVLQQYRKPNTGVSDSRLELAPHASAWPHGFLEKIDAIVQSCELRGFDHPAATLEAGAA
jgi:pyruvate formate lyase activating enzyme